MTFDKLSNVEQHNELIKQHTANFLKWCELLNETGNPVVDKINKKLRDQLMEQNVELLMAAEFLRERR